MKMPLRRKSRYQKARNAVKGMLHETRKRVHRRPEPIEHTEKDYSALHWMTGALFVAAGAEAALGERRGDYRPDPIRWAPFVAAPLAGAAQAARALWPSRTTRMISQLVNGVALGVGAAGLASSVNDVIREHRTSGEDDHDAIDHVPSLAPLAFGAVGLLAVMLDNDDDDDDYEEVQRPRRRPPVKRIIVRV